MELSNEDVADILALLDSLPYNEFDLQTPRFRLTLRRVPGGGWTEESQILADPVAIKPAADGAKAGARAGTGRLAADPMSSSVGLRARVPGTAVLCANVGCTGW